MSSDIRKAFGNLRKDVFFGGVILLVVFGPFLYTSFRRLMTRRELAHERNLAAAEGLPMKAEDLRPKVAIPDSQNAGPRFTKVFQILFPKGPSVGRRSGDKKWFDAIRTLRAWNRPAPDKAIDEALAVLHKPLELALGASTLPFCDFKRDWKLGPNVLMPELSSMKFLVFALLFEARSYIANRRRAEASERILASCRICNLIRQEPTPIGAICAVSFQKLPLSYLEELQSQYPDDPYWTDLAKKAISALGPPIDLRNALRFSIFEESRISEYIETLKMYAASSHPEYLIHYELSESTDLAVLRAYRKVIKAWPKDPVDYLAIREAALGPTKEMDAALAAYSRRIVMIWEPRNANGDGMIGHLALTAAEGLARRRLSLQFAETMAFKRKTGHFPAQLPLPGDAAIDPLSKDKLHYWVGETSFAIYGIGRDLLNNGGDPKDDIVVRYP